MRSKLKYNIAAWGVAAIAFLIWQRYNNKQAVERIVVTREKENRQK
jgi:hypothetical protein